MNQEGPNRMHAERVARYVETQGWAQVYSEPLALRFIIATDAEAGERARGVLGCDDPVLTVEELKNIYAQAGSEVPRWAVIMAAKREGAVVVGPTETAGTQEAMDI